MPNMPNKLLDSNYYKNISLLKKVFKVGDNHTRWKSRLIQNNKEHWNQ